MLGLWPATAAATTFTVSNTNDSGTGSLRDAVSMVNSGSGGDTIVIPASTTPYVLTSGELAITKPVTITGAGAGSTTISGNHTSRIFDFQNAGPNAVSGVTLTAGTAVFGGAIQDIAGGTLELSSIAASGNSASVGAGAVDFGDGTLTITNSSFSSNTAVDFDGAVEAGGGGSSHDTITISSSTFSDNSATGSSSDTGALSLGGGGTSNDTLTITGSTFANNRAASFGGAISASGGGGNTDTLTVTNTTIVGNTVSAPNGDSAGAAMFAATTVLRSDTIDGNSATGASSFGGGLFAPTSATVVNTIIAGNTAHTGGNCGAPLTSQGHNIESADTCGFTASTDHTNTDPGLGTLADNGGSTETQALSSGSPAIDAGDNSSCPSTDQRGVPRPQGPACDIGAYELAPPSASTGTASGVGPTTAALSGHAANPDAVGATVSFQYGTSTAYGSQTSAQSLAAMTGSTGFTAAISGLAPGTLHHFRTVTVNPDGTSFGADQTFTTAPAAPVLSKLTVKPRRFRAKHRATISYQDSQAATTAFTVLKAMRGYRVGGRCVAHRGRARHAKRCTRYVRIGSFRHQDVAGANRFRLPRRVHKHRLSPGHYKLQAVARNGIGEQSARRATIFTITT
jgi:hypothetical protein